MAACASFPVLRMSDLHVCIVASALLPPHCRFSGCKQRPRYSQVPCIMRNVQTGKCTFLLIYEGFLYLLDGSGEDMDLDRALDCLAASSARTTNEQAWGALRALVAQKTIPARVAALPDPGARVAYVRRLRRLGYSSLEPLEAQALLEEVDRRFANAKARLIQARFRRAVSDPAMLLCQRRLLREFEGLTEAS